MALSTLIILTYLSVREAALAISHAVYAPLREASTARSLFARLPAKVLE